MFKAHAKMGKNQEKETYIQTKTMFLDNYSKSNIK